MDRNCSTCKFWLNRRRVGGYSLCTMAERLSLTIADVLLREDDSEVSQEDIAEAESQAGAMVYLNTLDDAYSKYVSVLTRADFSCSEWGRRTYE